MILDSMVKTLFYSMMSGLLIVVVGAFLLRANHWGSGVALAILLVATVVAILFFAIPEARKAPRLPRK